MRDPNLEAFARQPVDTGAQRRSLLALGGAALAAHLADPAAARAKKGKKNNDRCKKQVGQCREGLAGLCEAVFGPEGVDECVALFAPCCEPLKGCNTAQALDCATEVVNNIAT